MGLPESGPRAGRQRRTPSPEDAMTRMLPAAAALGLSLAWAAGGAQAQTGAKALFYGSAGSTVMPGGAGPGVASRLGTGLSAPGTAAPAAQDYMGVSYWVELVDGPQGPRRVTSDHVFRGGDRIKLGLKTNRDGYLYLINLGSTGRSQVLFPSGAAGEASNLVRANTVYEMPPGGHLRFDSNPGEEVLVLMLAPSPLAPRAPAGPAPAAGDDAVRDLVQAAEKKAQGQRGAKDLVLEVDRTGPAPATYAVAPASTLGDGGVISLRIRLRHQ